MQDIEAGLCLSWKIGTSGLCGESFSLLRRSAACRRRVPGAFVQTNPNHKRQRESQKMRGSFNV